MNKFVLASVLLIGCASNGEDLDQNGENNDGSLVTGDAQVEMDSEPAVDAKKPPRDAPIYVPVDSGPKPDCSKMKIIIRDFTPKTHPDFEKFMGSVANVGIVEAVLGADGKPVLASLGKPVVITSAESFNQWYNDVEGINQRIEIEVPLTTVDAGPNATGATFEYSSTAFFPIDGKGYGNEGRTHNYHFTSEIHTMFTYRGGEELSFDADDDYWLFLKDQLVLDVGGVHPSVVGSVKLDDLATKLGLKIGDTVPMHVFQAERHTTQSNFKFKTNIECFQEVIVI